MRKGAAPSWHPAMQFAWRGLLRTSWSLCRRVRNCSGVSYCLHISVWKGWLSQFWLSVSYLATLPFIKEGMSKQIPARKQNSSVILQWLTRGWLFLLVRKSSRASPSHRFQMRLQASLKYPEVGRCLPWNKSWHTVSLLK